MEGKSLLGLCIGVGAGFACLVMLTGLVIFALTRFL